MVEISSNIQPLLFAGMIIEGGIIGYDTNIETGGKGARYLGIGGSSQYRRDSVVVSLRGVSTLTGEVILNVQTYKTILSVGMGGDVFRFLDMDTKLLELETGMTQNESVTWAVRSAIEAAVLALIEQGDERGYWTIGGSDELPEDISSDSLNINSAIDDEAELGEINENTKK
mgnify:FL=1